MCLVILASIVVTVKQHNMQLQYNFGLKLRLLAAADRGSRSW